MGGVLFVSQIFVAPLHTPLPTTRTQYCHKHIFFNIVRYFFRQFANNNHTKHSQNVDFHQYLLSHSVENKNSEKNIITHKFKGFTFAPHEQLLIYSVSFI